MYKMKEVCTLTELPEKTVRYYIQEELVQPEVAAGLHYKSYRFSDIDIQRLKDIAALRSAEFSISEIREMLQNPDVIPGMIMQKEAAISAKIDSLQSIQGRLQNMGVKEHTVLSELADAIEPRSIQRKETPENSSSRLLWLLVYGAVFLVLGFTVIGGKLVWITGAALLFMAGISFPFIALRCFIYNHTYRKMPNRAVGTIAAIITDTDANDAWADSTGEQLLGLINLGFFHWSWIQPDHWVPLIQIEQECTFRSLPYRYGAFRDSWRVGVQVPVAWNPARPDRLYPCADPVLNRLSAGYLVIGLLALIIFCLFSRYLLLGGTL